MDLHEKAKEFKRLENDFERWKWVKENADLVTVWLDNDDTYATFDDEDEGCYVLQFSDFLGSGSGVDDLLSSIGIKSSGV